MDETDKELGFAVCGCDSGQGSCGVYQYTGIERVHNTIGEAQKEFDALPNDVKGFYKVCRIIETVREKEVVLHTFVKARTLIASPIR